MEAVYRTSSRHASETLRAQVSPTWGWFKCVSEAWPEIAEKLVGSWPEAAVGTDLAWWCDQVRRRKAQRIPSYRALADRWGWTHHRAREALRALGESGPGYERRQSGTNRDEPAAPAGLPSKQEEGMDLDYSGMSRFDDEDRERAEAEGAAPRVATAKPAEAKVDEAEVERRVRQRLAEEAAEQELQAERRRQAMLGSVEQQATIATLAERAGAPLAAEDVKAIREHFRRGGTGEDILVVDDWMRQSDAREPVWMRGEGHTSPRSWLNSRFPVRLAAARAWSTGGMKDAPAAPRQQPRRENAYTRSWRSIQNALREEQEAAVVEVVEVEVVKVEAAPPPAAQIEDQRDSVALNGGDLW